MIIVDIHIMCHIQGCHMWCPVWLDEDDSFWVSHHGTSVKVQIMVCGVEWLLDVL